MRWGPDTARSSYKHLVVANRIQLSNGEHPHTSSKVNSNNPLYKLLLTYLCFVFIFILF